MSDSANSAKAHHPKRGVKWMRTKENFLMKKNSKLLRLQN